MNNVRSTNKINSVNFTDLLLLERLLHIISTAMIHSDQTENKLKVYVAFTNEEQSEQYNESIDKIIKASSIFTQFGLKKINQNDDFMIHYRVKGELHKKERLLQTVTNGTQRTFYIVSNWNVNENARLYSVCKLWAKF